MLKTSVVMKHHQIPYNTAVTFGMTFGVCYGDLQKKKCKKKHAPIRRVRISERAKLKNVKCLWSQGFQVPRVVRY